MSETTNDNTTDGLEEPQFSPVVKAILAVVAVLVIIGAFVVTSVIPTCDSINSVDNNSAYFEEALATVVERPVNLVLWIQDAQDADEGELTSAQTQEAIDLIDQQLDGLNTLSTWENPPDDASDFISLLKAYVRSETPLLEEMRAVLADGALPSQDLLSEYAHFHSSDLVKELEVALEQYLLQYSIQTITDQIAG